MDETITIGDPIARVTSVCLYVIWATALTHLPDRATLMLPLAHYYITIYTFILKFAWLSCLFPEAFRDEIEMVKLKLQHN